MRARKNFWDRNAGLYDCFMRKDKAVYEKMYELICSVVKDKTVLELAASEYEPYLSFDIDDENTIKYLKCETLDVDTNTEGIHLVGTNEFPLGWAKIKKGRLKNKYSSSWRWL